MDKKIGIFIGILGVALAAAFGIGNMLGSGGGNSNGAPTGSAADSAADGSDTSVKEVDVTASQFRFEPSTIRVKKGQKLRLFVQSTDVTHGISIPEFNVNKRLPPGQPATIEFTPDKTGTFTFLCSVYCGSGHSSMRGRIIVE